MTIGLLAALAAAGAGLGMRRCGHAAATRRLWWVAALGAGLGAAVAAATSPVPAAAGLAAGGLTAAAVVDAAEVRIPTALAHGTTALSLALLVGHAVVTGERNFLIRGVTCAAVLVLGVCVPLWLAGGMGFGDVRLAAATVTGLVGGAGALVVLLSVAFVVAGLGVVLRRLRGVAGSGGGTVPFGPGLALGWLFAVALT